MELHRPLIYLIGLDKDLYQVVHPVCVTADSPDALTFRIEADAKSLVFDPAHADVVGRARAREYATVTAKRRLHQYRFRHEESPRRRAHPWTAATNARDSPRSPTASPSARSTTRRTT
jgi:hypothetical protein